MLTAQRRRPVAGDYPGEHNPWPPVVTSSIAAGVRTPLGNFGGRLRNTPMSDQAAHAIRASVVRAGLGAGAYRPRRVHVDGSDRPRQPVRGPRRRRQIRPAGSRPGAVRLARLRLGAAGHLVRGAADRNRALAHRRRGRLRRVQSRAVRGHDGPVGPCPRPASPRRHARLGLPLPVQPRLHGRHRRDHSATSSATRARRWTNGAR